MKPSRRTSPSKAPSAAPSPWPCRPPAGRREPALSGIRTIPSSGEAIPAVGLGTYVTFNVGEDLKLRDECAAVLAAFFEAGGGMIDSSPMYGSSQDVIGYGLSKLDQPTGLFAADKVWTPSADGTSQIEETTQPLAAARLRSSAGPQSGFLARALGDPLPDEGFRAVALCRDHHLPRTAPRPVREGDARAAARFRATHLQHRGPRGGGPSSAPGPGEGHRGDREPPLPARGVARPPARRSPARWAIEVGAATWPQFL